MELKEILQKYKKEIQQNTKDSWKKIYGGLDYFETGVLTEFLLTEMNFDPAEIMGEMPGYYLDRSKIKDYTVPSNIKSIGVGAFRGCTNLTSITIPNGVTSIGNYAFEGCSGLTSITIPNSVESIGRSTFRGCSGLTSIAVKRGKRGNSARNN